MLGFLFGALGWYGIKMYFHRRKARASAIARMEREKFIRGYMSRAEFSMLSTFIPVMAAAAAINMAKHVNAKRKNEPIDIDYEVIEPKQLNTGDDV